MAKLHNIKSEYTICREIQNKKNEKTETNVQTKRSEKTHNIYKTSKSHNSRLEWRLTKPFHFPFDLAASVDIKLCFCISMCQRKRANVYVYVSVYVFSVFAKWHGSGTPTVFQTLMSFTIKPISMYALCFVIWYTPLLSIV